MRYRKLTSSGDNTFCSGSTQFLVNTPATVGQSALTRLLLATDEWFLDVTVGTPYAEAVVGKYTTGTYDAAIKTRILATQGVVSILSYQSTLTPDDRLLNVVVTVNTIYGPVTITSSVDINTGQPLITPDGTPLVTPDGTPLFAPT